MRIAILAVGGLVALTAPAAAQQYDIAAYCQRVASFGGTHSNTLELACRQQEASARDQAGRMQVAPSIRQHCDRVASFTGAGSYTLFVSCVQQEQAAAQQLGR